VVIYRAFRFRIYPNRAQLEQLRRWEVALRWLWNLANEQHELGLRRCGHDRVYVRYASQNRELTVLRSLCPWLNEVPSPLCQSVLRDLDTAWRRHYEGASRRPRYKSRAKDHRTALRCDAANLVRLDAQGVKHFPKLGRLKTIVHRPIDGKARTFALVREGTQWFVSITCQIEVSPSAPRLSPNIGIARLPGHVYAASDGRIVREHPKVRQTRIQLLRARRIHQRRTKGSKRSDRSQQRIIQLQCREKRQRAHLLHVESKRLAENQGNVIAELSVHVRVPETVDADWRWFRTLLKYKLQWRGGHLVEERRPPQRIDGKVDGRIAADVGIAAAIRVLNAWESLVSARGRQPARQVRKKRESDAQQGQSSLRQAHRTRS
jgi:putative transposase